MRVLAHQGYFLYGYGASPLTEPPPEMMNLSPPVTGYGGDVYTRYYFMKVTNTSSDRDIVLTHAWFADAPREMLLTRRPLPVRLAYDDTWEGWLNAATLAPVRNVERSGRALISGKTPLRGVIARPSAQASIQVVRSPSTERRPEASSFR